MRSRTPPLLKWLLVERATLAGNITRTLERTDQLHHELAQAQERHVATGQALERLLAAKTQLPRILAGEQARLAALDTTIALASEDRALPTAGGTVRAFCSQYGKRGKLKAFILERLAAAVPNSVDTATLANQAIAHFRLVFVTLAERQAFSGNILRRQLARLRDEGIVEMPFKPKKGDAASWRLKRGMPLLEVLRSEEAAAGSRLAPKFGAPL